MGFIDNACCLCTVVERLFANVIAVLRCNEYGTGEFQRKNVILFEWENKLADLFLRTVLLIGATMLSALQNTGFTGRLLTTSIVISCVSSLPLFSSRPSMNAFFLLIPVWEGYSNRIMGVFWYKLIKLFKKFFLVLKPLFLTRSIEVVRTIDMPLVCHWHVMSCSILRTHCQSFPNYCSQLGRVGCIISVLGWIIVGWYVFVLGMDDKVRKYNLRICLFFCSRCLA